jgi:hypothetical protein
MQDPALASAMGLKGQQFVHENLDVRKMTDSYLNLYQKLITKKGAETKKIPFVAKA